MHVLERWVLDVHLLLLSTLKTKALLVLPTLSVSLLTTYVILVPFSALDIHEA